MGEQKKFKWPFELDCKGLNGEPVKFMMPSKGVADMVYRTQGVGVRGSAFAIKLYNADEKTEFSRDEFEFLIQWGENTLSPMAIDGLKEYVK